METKIIEATNGPRNWGLSNATDARQSFERAVEIARGQSAKSYELRATTSLARLLAKQGLHDEARRI